MSSTQTGNRQVLPGIQEITTRYSLYWLFLANLVGLLLAALLVWPRLNDWISPFTYGRWLPLHMDWHLYGWCSLPLLGLIHSQFLAGEYNSGKWLSISFILWSISLLTGGASWLMGGVTGKLFLNWAGMAGIVFGATLVAIWLILAGFWIREVIPFPGFNASIIRTLAKGMVLLGLLGVPFVLIYTSDPAVYPPVNPESGGATGHSLLASTLSLVFLMGLLPRLGLALGHRKASQGKIISRLFWPAFAISIAVYLVIHHGNASNYEYNQIFGLGTLLIWPVLVLVHWEQYIWVSGSAKWRLAFIAWWALLAADGWLIFLPGVLDLLKFTNALVGHSHLAMAGMVTSLNMIILLHLGSSRNIQKVITNNAAFWLWNCGCLVYVLAMTLQGMREGIDPGVLYGTNTYTEFYYIIRLAAGVALVGASAFWIYKISTPLYRRTPQE